jgi:hypothetical protein
VRQAAPDAQTKPPGHGPLPAPGSQEPPAEHTRLDVSTPSAHEPLPQGVPGTDGSAVQPAVSSQP